MTKHKQAKALRRRKLVKKGAYSGTSTKYGVRNKAIREESNKCPPEVKELNENTGL